MKGKTDTDSGIAWTRGIAAALDRVTVSKPYEDSGAVVVRTGPADEELGPVIHDLKNAAAALRLRVVLLARDEPRPRMQNLQQAVEHVCACVEKLSQLSR